MATFYPRLSKKGMWDNKHWYSATNPFYPAGFGLPNCTCYAWGRFWEITGVVPHLPTLDGGSWWGAVTGYKTGQTPQLGAVMCFSQAGRSGHVAIVEEIKSNGDVVASNSGWSRNGNAWDNPLYFWVDTHPKRNNYLSDWQVSAGYRFQGFIYNPDQPIPPDGGGGVYPDKKKKMPLYFYTKLF